jgi:hypothetical protein
LDEDPFMRRKFRRKMHPQMMMDLTHHIGARLSDPVRLLISASVYKDELPWLYELALEAYRSFIGGNPNEAMRALDQYRKAVDVLREGPFLDMLGMDGKMGYVMLRDALEYLPPMEDFDNDMVNDELKPTRTRKKAPF